MNPIRYAQLIFALVLVGAGTYFVFSYRNMAERLGGMEQRIEAAETRADDLQRKYDTLNGEIIIRDQVTSLIRESRTQVSQRVDKAEREDAPTRDYLREPLPAGLRDAILDRNAAER